MLKRAMTRGQRRIHTTYATKPIADIGTKSDIQRVSLMDNVRVKPMAHAYSIASESGMSRV